MALYGSNNGMASRVQLGAKVTGATRPRGPADLAKHSVGGESAKVADQSSPVPDDKFIAETGERLKCRGERRQSAPRGRRESARER